MEVIVKIDPTLYPDEKAVFAMMDKDYADYVTVGELTNALDSFCDNLCGRVVDFMQKHHPDVSITSANYKEKSRDVKMSDIFPVSEITIIPPSKPQS